uniref:Uncharacterized protein n=1 Tax=Knipowitschia caucasica TaxID=637954 RepID=A0AAV2JEB4_KNICA
MEMVCQVGPDAAAASSHKTETEPFFPNANKRLATPLVTAATSKQTCSQIHSTVYATERRRPDIMHTIQTLALLPHTELEHKHMSIDDKSVPWPFQLLHEHSFLLLSAVACMLLSPSARSVLLLESSFTAQHQRLPHSSTRGMNGEKRRKRHTESRREERALAEIRAY